MMLPSGIPQLLFLFALKTCPITLPTKVHAFQAHSNRPGRQSRQRRQTRDPRTQRAHEDRPPDKLGRFFDVEPQWEGSSYSYVRPTPRKAALPSKETKTTLEFPHTGTFTLELHTYRVSRNGTTNTGFTLWSSAIAVASYLDDQLHGSNPPVHDGHITSLELGAGLGLPSMVIARSGVVHRVVTTDLPEILPLLELNLHTNLEPSYFFPLEQQPGSKQQYARVETFALDWTQHQHKFANRRPGPRYHSGIGRGLECDTARLVGFLVSAPTTPSQLSCTMQSTQGPVGINGLHTTTTGHDP